MADKYHILYWRDIPSIVKAKIGRKRISQPLSDRFMEAIDMAAMRDGEVGSDAYLEHWKASDNFDIEGDPQTHLKNVSADLEAEFPRDRLLAIAKNGGVIEGAVFN